VQLSGGIPIQQITFPTWMIFSKRVISPTYKWDILGLYPTDPNPNHLQTSWDVEVGIQSPKLRMVMEPKYDAEESEKVI